MERYITLFFLVSGLLCYIHGDSELTPSYHSYCTSVMAAHHLPRTCLDLRCYGYTYSGVYTVHPTGLPYLSFDVYCDQETDGGGWTVFQRRMDGSTDFYRNWYNYKLGFGHVTSEHWLGNDKLAKLTGLHDNNELRVDLEAVDNRKVYAKYSTFKVGAEATKYKVTVYGYSGNAGDSFGGVNGMKFTTRDYDYDTWGDNCAVRYHGAWWYTACHESNLNGHYLNGTHASFADGVNWNKFKGYHESLKTTEMKFRPQF